MDGKPFQKHLYLFTLKGNSLNSYATFSSYLSVRFKKWSKIHHVPVLCVTIHFTEQKYLKFPCWYMQLKAQNDNTAFLQIHVSYFKWDFCPVLRYISALLKTFASWEQPPYSTYCRSDKPVVQYTQGTCTEIHQHILLSSEEIIDLLQAVNTVLVKAHLPVPLSLWSCNDKIQWWKPQKVSSRVRLLPETSRLGPSLLRRLL